MVIRVVGAAIVEGDRVLAARRGPGRALAGLWEFPGGKVEPGETDATALRRELSEELGLEATLGPCLGESHFRSPKGDILLVVYVAEAGGTPMPTEHDAIAWLGPDELTTVTWSPADVPLLDAVRALLILQQNPGSSKTPDGSPPAGSRR